MTRPQKPRRGTPAYSALERLQVLGGVATTAQLQVAVLSHFRSASRLDQMVIRPLVALGFIESVKEGVRITADGTEYLKSGAALGSTGRNSIGSTALSAQTEAYVPPKFMQMVERRPGSLDYRKIPSLIAGREVPFAVGSLGSGSKDGEKQ